MIKLLDELKGLAAAFQSISPMSVVILIILQGLTLGAILLQWHCLASGMGLILPIRRLIHVHMTGTFFEGITPSVKAGGEAAKIFLLKGCGISAGVGTALVLLQKAASLIVFLALNILAAAGLFAAGTRSAGAIIGGSQLFLMLFCLLLVLLLSHPSKWSGLLSCLPAGARFKKAAAVLAGQMQEAIRGIPSKRQVLSTAMLLSTFIWMLYGMKAILIAQALGLSSGIFPVVVTAYLSYMAGMIPLLPGGTGTFESACVLLLSAQGVSVPQAIAFSLLLRGITYWLPFGMSALYAGLSGLHRLLYRPVQEAYGTERGQ